MFANDLDRVPSTDEGELRDSMASFASILSGPTNRSIISPNWTPRQSAQLSPLSTVDHSALLPLHEQLEDRLASELEHRLHIAEERYRLEAAEHLRSLEAAHVLLEEERARRLDLEQRLHELESRHYKAPHALREDSDAREEPPLDASYEGTINKRVPSTGSTIEPVSISTMLGSSGKKKIGIKSLFPAPDRRPRISKPWAAHHLAHMEMDSKTGQLKSHPPQWQALLDDEHESYGGDPIEWIAKSPTLYTEHTESGKPETQREVDEFEHVHIIDRSASPPPLYTGIAH
ncbi:hypothetical protein BKA62DRAFT_717352 [Auriculariales sp. MPI-PUGE-AT-0066]|nr:hypothetical protein BKA62DRAFT_717352 [Auriculariales sp. MPI-PUGE-AT-0066]